MRSLVTRVRRRADGAPAMLVGAIDPRLAAAFDVPRGGAAARGVSPFEVRSANRPKRQLLRPAHAAPRANPSSLPCRLRALPQGGVVVNHEAYARVLDVAFARAGIGAGDDDNEQGASVRGGRLLLTECVLCPRTARAQTAELAFEGYGVDALALLPDAPLAAYGRAGAGGAGTSCISVCCGHSATSIVPIVGGAPKLDAAVRLNVGGGTLAAACRARVAGANPSLAAQVSVERAEEILHTLCYVAQGAGGAYDAAVDALARAEHPALFPRRGGRAEGEADASVADADVGMPASTSGPEPAVPRGLVARVQLPWTPPKEKPQPTEEDLERRRQARAAAAQRFRDMARARREKKAEDKEAAVNALDALCKQIAHAASVDGAESAHELAIGHGYKDAEHVQLATAAAKASVRVLRGQPAEPGDDVAEAMLKRKEAPVRDYSLLQVPDEELDTAQRKEKQKLRLLKGSEDARQRKREAKAAAEAAEERRRVAEEEEAARDPEGYLSRLRTKIKVLTAKVDERRSRRKKSGSSSGAGAPDLTSSGRRSNARRSKMRMVASAAFDDGKDDTFGADDDDWRMYRVMAGEDSDSDEAKEDEEQLGKLIARLRELDPDAAAVAEAAAAGGDDVHVIDASPETAETYQLRVGASRVWVPEALFQPEATIGAPASGGLVEAILSSLRRLEPHEAAAAATGGVLLSGGVARMPGLRARLEAELRAVRPVGDAIAVHVAGEGQPELAPWRGAAAMAADGTAWAGRRAVDRATWEECGADYLLERPQQFFVA